MTLLPAAARQAPQSPPPQEAGPGSGAPSPSLCSDETAVAADLELDGLAWPVAPGKAPHLPPCPSLPLPGDLRLSCMTNGSGRHFLLSSTIKRGTYGKLKYALPIDDLTEAFAVKELRLKPCEPRPGKDPTLSRQQRRRTAVTPWEVMRLEWSMSRRFGGPFAPHHGLVLDRRAYFFFDMAADTLLGVVTGGTPAPYRALLARYVAREVGGTLLAMRNHGALHLDVSPSNILLSKQAPYVALADFGTSQAVPSAPYAYGQASTYCSPEAVLHKGTISSRTDLWSLGASLLTVLKPPKPALLACVLREDDGLDREGTALMLQDFLNVGAGERADSAHPTVAWLRRCEQVDGPLTALLLRTVLVRKPQRSHVAKFLQDLQQLPPLPGFADIDHAMDALARSWADKHRSSAEYAAMDALRAWLHHRGHLPQEPRVEAA